MTLQDTLDALSAGDVAAVLIEPIPATFGFPIPDEDYFLELRALDLCAAEKTTRNVAEMSAFLAEGLADIQSRHPFLSDVRQRGSITGLGFDDPHGGMRISAALYPTGLWAMFAGFDRRYLQWKPGLLVDRSYLGDALEKLETAIRHVTG